MPRCFPPSISKNTDLMEEEDKKTTAAAEFEPKIVAFVCNWCTYAGADLTGTSRIKYATNVRVVRFPCTGRIDFMLVLKAFASGADGIIVSGCHPNDCHYTAGNFHARRRWMVLRGLLDPLFVGLGRRRRQVGRTGQRYRRADTRPGTLRAVPKSSRLPEKRSVQWISGSKISRTSSPRAK